MASKTNSALLKGQIDNQTLEQQLPFVEGSVGPRAVDIRSLYQKSGVFTYDPGYTSTASCSSKITYIDGDKGVLMHRGYMIEDLTEKCDFLEVCHLLLKGELPNLDEKQKFDRTITEHTMLHDQVQYFFRGFRRDAHPMAVMVGVAGALSAFYHDSLDINNPHHRWVSSVRLLAKMPTIAAWAYKYSIGQPFLSPVNSLSFTENFLRMTFGVPAEDYHVAPEVVRVLDQIFILHADHEQNASTSTVRLAGSSGANPFACIAAGISSLWGPAHGGANEAVLSMLSEIGTEDRIGEYLARARDKNDPFRLSGFGHRVYREFDPRAKVLRDSAHTALNALGVTDEPRLRLALKLEKIALEDEYFVSRKLFPNVDFYSGIILSAMGFPVTMFTALFALARTVGWVSHWNEMMSDPDKKIGRPRQIYTGEPHRKFVAIANRGKK